MFWLLSATDAANVPDSLPVVSYGALSIVVVPTGGLPAIT